MINKTRSSLLLKVSHEKAVHVLKKDDEDEKNIAEDEDLIE